MSLTGTGRKTAVLCTAVVLSGTLAVPAHASALPAAAASALLVPALIAPAAPQIKVTDIERILADAASAQELTFARTLEANKRLQRRARGAPDPE